MDDNMEIFVCVGHLKPFIAQSVLFTIKIINCKCGLHTRCYLRAAPTKKTIAPRNARYLCMYMRYQERSGQALALESGEMDLTGERCFDVIRNTTNIQCDSNMIYSIPHVLESILE